MIGKILKGIGGFYYVINDEVIYECRAKGIFRKKNEKPLVGDNVEFELTCDTEKVTGNITKILERKNSLIRPEVANVDQVLLVFALKNPNPNLNLLDRFLIMMEYQKIDVVICFNKVDISSDDNTNEIADIYRSAGYKVIITSTKEKIGIDEVNEILKGKSTVMAGPSGVGKSSMLNTLTKEVVMETGDISKKIKRGKNTTRHSEIFAIGNDTYLIDTPGFSSLFIPGMTKENLERLFPEFEPFMDKCRFVGCAHINEPDCQVKNALADGLIKESRYENYKLIYNELKESEKRYD